ncbi:MAG: hypothetical protein M3173_07115, partial [Chloroflexota bacterium]|nr:hypothetical protein [Chloroflexota bacterium]
MNSRLSELLNAITADDLFELTAEYAAIDAVSGHEQDLVRRLRDDLQPLVDELLIDHFGNIAGTRQG